MQTSWRLSRIFFTAGWRLSCNFCGRRSACYKSLPAGLPAKLTAYGSNEDATFPVQWQNCTGCSVGYCLLRHCFGLTVVCLTLMLFWSYFRLFSGCCRTANDDIYGKWYFTLCETLWCKTPIRSGNHGHSIIIIIIIIDDYGRRRMPLSPHLLQLVINT